MNKLDELTLTRCNMKIESKGKGKERRRKDS